MHRDDPILPRTGGPAGNARLTAWFGLILLALFLVETFTLLSLHQMLTVHILVGAALVPLLLVKTATTGWRVARYYLGDAAYRQAGPPPMPLRVLGPLVVLSGVAVLGSGLALIALGNSSRTTFVTVAGFAISPLTVHQATFVIWAAVTGVHVLARTLPAVQLTVGRSARLRVPGTRARILAIGVGLVISAVTGVLVMHAARDWTTDRGGFRFGDHGGRHG